MNVYIRHLVAIPLLTLLLFACEGQQSPAPQASATEVTVVTLRTQHVTISRQLPGRTTPFVIAEVRPQVRGIVRQRLFTEGSLVQAGQALYQLDDETYRADVNSAKALLARAQASADIESYNAERAEQLFESNAISEQELLIARATQRQAEADVGVAEANLVSAEVRLGYARITSPIDGRIGKSAVTRGALVTADQLAPLSTVQQLDPIYVDLMRSASELLELRRELSSGAAQKTESIPVKIILEGGTRYEHAGELVFSDVAVDPMTDSFTVRVVVPNPDNILMPGMYVRAVVSDAVLDQGLLVPQQGIFRDAKGNASAMLVNDVGTVEQRTVQVNRTVGEHWLVDSGLVEGDRVIVEGLQKIRPGMSVVAIEASANSEGQDKSINARTGSGETDTQVQ